MNRTQALWRARLGSAFRTAIACTIVGCATLFGPAHLRHQLAFPAFSYLTTILIVSDATLGDTLRGFWHAFYATIQVVPQAMLTLWVIGPARFTAGKAALAVALSVFVVALPESTHLMSKRIAFGQIVIVYVGAVVQGAQTGVFRHPLHVACCTALGALASVLALFLPYPRLAYFEVREACRMYAQNASERVSFLVKAFSALDNSAALDLISQAQYFSEVGAKLVQSIKLVQEGMVWEAPQIRLLKPNCMNPVNKLQKMELPMRGMELALNSCPTFPVCMIGQRLRDALPRIEVQMGLKLEQAKCSLPFATTAPETKQELADNSFQSLTTFVPTDKDLPGFFFLFCVQLLQDDSTFYLTPEPRDSTKQAKCDNLRRICSLWNMIRPNKESLTFAFKCSLSLGLAVLIGLIYNKENAYWSGLTIAISFVTGRQATFTVANARAQGTVMGSVYGVLGCFILQEHVEARFILLLPWIVFTTFLKHSRMYGQSGGISAVIGALLILGRKNYGPPSVFAIARITEAFIGLTCLIMVEFLLQPKRAASLAKIQLSQILGTVHECVEEIEICGSEKNMPASALLALREKQNKLKSQIEELERFIGEAKLEPNLWFLPFRDSCYTKLLGSLLKMKDLFLFVVYEIEFLSKVSKSSGVSWKEHQEHVNHDLELFKEKIGFSLNCLEEITLIRSLAVLEKKLQKKISSDDIELGKLPEAAAFKLLSSDEEEVENILISFLQHSKEANDKINASECEEELKTQMVLSLSGLGFCIRSLMNETIEIEKQVKELIKWENSLTHIDLAEISWKINALCTYKSSRSILRK